MLAHEALRKAAEIVANGWAGGEGHAKDDAGGSVTLFTAGTEGTSRTTINPAATRFSLYGAVVKVISDRANGVTVQGPIWDKLFELSRARLEARLGGQNSLHPVIQFNADPGRTAEDVAQLLNDAADALDPAKQEQA